MIEVDSGNATAVDKSAPRLMVRTIGVKDIGAVLARGFDDFMSMPSHVLFLSVAYPILGLVLGTLTFGYALWPLLFPLITGFALIGPFAAIGLYELSRRRQQGLEVSWAHAFDVLRSPSIGAIVTLGAILLAIFLVWLATAQMIYSLIFDNSEPISLGGFVHDVLTTQRGWVLIVVGTAAGSLFAVAAFAISVVSFPLLLDRQVSVATAVQTSVKAVLANPKVMAIWGLIVAGALVMGSLPFLIGLAVVMPVLGHATWHLYRKLVEPPLGAPAGTGPGGSH